MTRQGCAAMVVGGGSNDMAAAFMQLELHGSGIHVVSRGAGGPEAR
jgi:hypothetical protein